MQSNIEQLCDSSLQSLEVSNVASFERCVLELVANSLNAQATAIAVRIHAEKREIQVVDNGVGISKDMLKNIAEYDSSIISDQQVYKSAESNYLTDIRSLTDRLMIASRHQCSTKTFMKVFEGPASTLKQIEQRPLCGTTVSIYGLHNIPLCKKYDVSVICLFIAVIAVAETKVSFSIRDEDRKKVILRIAKPHSPVEVLRTLFEKDLPLNRVWSVRCKVSKFNANYHGYVGLSNNNATQWIFLNYRPIYCPLILQLIQVAFKERLSLSRDQQFNRQDLYERKMFILFYLTFPQREFTFVTENRKRSIMFRDMQKILNIVKSCDFKCLVEEATTSVVTPYLCETQLLKQMHFISKRFVFRDDVDRCKTATSLVMKNTMIDFKKQKITSTTITNCCDKQNEDNNIESVKYRTDEKEEILNGICCQMVSLKRTNLFKNTAEKVIDKNDKAQEYSTNVSAADNSFESKEAYNCCNSNNDDFINKISPLSEWSNWTYYTNDKKHDSARIVNNVFSENNTRSRQLFEVNQNVNQNQFYFLPRKLYGLLRCNVKLTDVKYLYSLDDTIPLQLQKCIAHPVTENWQLKKTMVHPCKLKQKLCEFKLTRASLKCIKVINQVNNEFIAAWMSYDKIKILLMIDQHAVHERIRYENLLLRHNVQTNEGELLSVNLRNPLSMELPVEMYNLLLRNKMLLRKYGISLGSTKENTILIRTIPQCLITNNDPCNSEKILPKIYNLLNEVLKSCNITNKANTLPLTIHNAIASKACHGAIKFGDKLTLEQCINLINLLKYTKFPNRCAHGRPTIIPMMEFSELEGKNARIFEVRLSSISSNSFTFY
ncbi:DNA mismatch repair protein MutL [Cardiocondyla obscurior]